MWPFFDFWIYGSVECHRCKRLKFSLLDSSGCLSNLLSKLSYDIGGVQTSHGGGGEGIATGMLSWYGGNSVAWFSCWAKESGGREKPLFPRMRDNGIPSAHVCFFWCQYVLSSLFSSLLVLFFLSIPSFASFSASTRAAFDYRMSLNLFILDTCFKQKWSQLVLFPGRKLVCWILSLRLKQWGLIN